MPCVFFYNHARVCLGTVAYLLGAHITPYYERQSPTFKQSTGNQAQPNTTGSHEILALERVGKIFNSFQNYKVQEKGYSS